MSSSACILCPFPPCFFGSVPFSFTTSLSGGVSSQSSLSQGFPSPSLQICLESSTDAAPFATGFFTPRAPSLQSVTLTAGAEIKPQKALHQLSCSRSSASFSHLLSTGLSIPPSAGPIQPGSASHYYTLPLTSQRFHPFPLLCSESLSSVSSSQSRIFKSFPAPRAHPATSPSGCNDPGAQHPQ